MLDGSIPHPGRKSELDCLCRRPAMAEWDGLATATRAVARIARKTVLVPFIASGSGGLLDDPDEMARVCF
jgi:hypothetical protein